MEKFEKYKDFSKSIRKNIIFMGKHGGSNSAHIGGALSLADIFSVLFSDFFKIKKGSTDNDKIILSKDIQMQKRWWKNSTGNQFN